jgi:hypothetical protein
VDATHDPALLGKRLPRGQHVGWQGAIWPEREATAQPDGGDFACAQGDLFAAAIAFSMYPQTGRKSYCDPNWVPMNKKV